jgi:hypothetical protein
MINCLHHFEILTNSSAKLLNYFTSGFNFNLVLSKQTGAFQQHLIRSNSINFLITSIADEPTLSNPAQNSPSLHSTSLESIQKTDPDLFNLVTNKKNTVFNAAFQVRDLDRILSNCAKHNVKVLKDKHVLFDQNKQKTEGYADCAIIKSCVDGVAHTLVELNQYKGQFLPGFEPNSHKNSNPSTLVTHFDHLTYATPKHT